MLQQLDKQDTGARGSADFGDDDEWCKQMGISDVESDEDDDGWVREETWMEGCAEITRAINHSFFSAGLAGKSFGALCGCRPVLVYLSL